jgi:hypothetical protein
VGALPKMRHFPVTADSLARVAALLRERNAIDAELAGLIQRPMTSGYLGDWIAAQVFGIELEASAVAAGIDGRTQASPFGAATRDEWSLAALGVANIASALLEPDPTIEWDDERLARLRQGLGSLTLPDG